MTRRRKPSPSSAVVGPQPPASDPGIRRYWIPPRADTPVTDDELAHARDDDASVELVETGRVVARSPTGLAFGISVDCRPTVRFLEKLADAIERTGRLTVVDDADDDDPPVT